MAASKELMQKVKLATKNIRANAGGTILEKLTQKGAIRPKIQIANRLFKKG
jgi:hypothetical protein